MYFSCSLHLCPLSLEASQHPRTVMKNSNLVKDRLIFSLYTASAGFSPSCLLAASHIRKNYIIWLPPWVGKMNQILRERTSVRHLVHLRTWTLSRSVTTQKKKWTFPISSHLDRTSLVNNWYKYRLTLGNILTLNRLPPHLVAKYQSRCLRNFPN